MLFHPCNVPQNWGCARSRGSNTWVPNAFIYCYYCHSYNLTLLVLEYFISSSILLRIRMGWAAIKLWKFSVYLCVLYFYVSVLLQNCFDRYLQVRHTFHRTWWTDVPVGFPQKHGSRSDRESHPHINYRLHKSFNE